MLRVCLGWLVGWLGLFVSCVWGCVCLFVLVLMVGWCMWFNICIACLAVCVVFGVVGVSCRI